MLSRRLTQSHVQKGGARRAIIVPMGDYDGRLRPIREVLVLSDRHCCFADYADESFIEQWEAEEDDGARDWVKWTLSALSALISPHLSKGTIEFVAVLASSECAFYERLLVRSDGSAEYHKCASENYARGENRSITSPNHQKTQPKALAVERVRSSSDADVDRVVTW